MSRYSRRLARSWGLSGAVAAALAALIQGEGRE